MPVIYYSYYSPVSDSIAAVSEQEHALGRRLLAKGLKDMPYSFPPGEADAEIQTGPNGKPYLSHYPDVHFNISHCSGLCACAFHSAPIGVDAELPGYFAEILIRRALSETEKSFLQSVGATLPLRQEWFYRFWTLKEAYVKMSGVGVDADLTGFSFSFAEGESGLSVACSDPFVSCFQTRLARGHILSLCHTEGNEAVTLVEI